MSEIIERIAETLQFSYARNAIVVAVLISLCASLLGVSLVLKRFSMIGDGLSHVAFGAMAVGTVLGVAPMAAALPITIAVAVLLLALGKKVKIGGDAMIAVLSVGSLAVGYMLLNIFPTSENVNTDVCGSLFGSTSILTLDRTDLILCVSLSVLVIAFFVLFYNKIFALTYDEGFVSATGGSVTFYNIVIAVVVAVLIVFAMKLIGALLISALISFPALTAMRLFKSFKKVTIAAAVISVTGALLGLLVSIAFATPVGASIVSVNIIFFTIATVIFRK